MDDRDKEISLHYENDVLSAMISLFGQLQRVESTKDIQISEDRKSISIREKDQDELVTFNFDYKPLEDKIFKWFHSGQEWLHLDKEESEMFRACSHAAYYHMTETTAPEQLKRNHFIQFHERYFKT